MYLHAYIACEEITTCPAGEQGKVIKHHSQYIVNQLVILIMEDVATMRCAHFCHHNHVQCLHVYQLCGAQVQKQ